MIFTVPALAQDSLYLYNGSFTQGDEFTSGPADWTTNEVDDSTTVWRDTVVYHSAPASLGITRTDTGNGGCFNQIFKTMNRLPAKQGQTFTLDAWVKIDRADSGYMALVAHYSCSSGWAECSTETGTQIGWRKLYIDSVASTGWLHVTATDTVPQDARWGLFRVYTFGSVAFHVDDIKINGQEEVLQIASRPNIHNLRLTTLDPGSIYLPNGRLSTSLPSRLPAGCYLVRSSKATLTRIFLAR